MHRVVRRYLILIDWIALRSSFSRHRWHCLQSQIFHQARLRWLQRPVPGHAFLCFVCRPCRSLSPRMLHLLFSSIGGHLSHLKSLLAQSWIGTRQSRRFWRCLHLDTACKQHECEMEVSNCWSSAPSQWYHFLHSQPPVSLHWGRIRVNHPLMTWWRSVLRLFLNLEMARWTHRCYVFLELHSL